MRLNLIFAVAANGVIGRDGGLPWPAFPEDMRYFKKVTTGHSVIMGRKTWESIPKQYRPLPDRINVVVSGTKGTEHFPGAIMTNGVRHAISICSVPSMEEVFVIGGEGVFRDTIAVADRLLVTEIDQEFEGNVFAPEIDPKNWQRNVLEASRSILGFNYRFVEHLRIAL